MSLARHMAVMRNAPFLRVLQDDALKLLAFGSEAQQLKPRQELFEAGDPANGAVLVLGGQLRLIPSSRVGVPVVAGVGQLVDELALIVATQRTATAMAQTSCEVLSIPRSQMLRILGEYPDAAMKLRATVAERASTMMGAAGKLADKLK